MIHGLCVSGQESEDPWPGGQVRGSGVLGLSGSGQESGYRHLCNFYRFCCNFHS